MASALRARVRRHVPIVTWLPAYDRSRLRTDSVAGVVVAALAVPQALGYATIAGVPVEVGLYSVPVALVAYAVFGSSRQLILGPASTVAVLSGSVVAAMRPADFAEAVVFTSAIAIWAGFVLVVTALLRVAWVAEFLSKPIVTGFVLGLTVLVIIGELPVLLGITVPRGDVLSRIRALVSGLDEVHPLTALIGVAALALLFVGSRLAPKVPWSLLVLVGGLAVSTAMGLDERDVVVVGHVPAGLPVPSFPVVPIARLPEIVIAGAAIAFVGLAEGLSAARLFAVKGGYRVSTEQELLAAGAGNAACGLVGGFAVAGSLSKTAAVARSGGTSQVAGLVAAALSLLVIVFFAPTLSDLPKAVLSAIVVHAVWGLIDVPAMRRYRATRRNDFVGACVAAVGVLAFGPLIGLLLAVAQSILGLVYRSSRVSIDVMGKVPGEKAAWGSVENHPEREGLPGVLVLRLNEPLFWVNAAQVHDRVLALADAYPDTKALILDLESSDQLETTSADMLAALRERLAGRGVDLYLVRVRFAVRTILRRTGLRATLGEDHIWHSISQGVREARRAHGLKPVPEPPVEFGHVPDVADDLPEDVPEVVVARTVSPEPDEPEEDEPAPVAARAAGSARGGGKARSKKRRKKARRR
jgi:high affinity sulfate transporter 1